MKKIIGIALVLLLVLGLGACSGDLSNGTYVYVSGVKLVNVPASREGTTLYVLEGWMPDNVWDATTPNKAVITGGTATIMFSAPAKVSLVDISAQVIAAFWSDKVEDGSKTKTTNLYDGATHLLEVDCTAHTAALK